MFEKKSRSKRHYTDGMSNDLPVKKKIKPESQNHSDTRQKK